MTGTNLTKKIQFENSIAVKPPFFLFIRHPKTKEIPTELISCTIFWY